MILIQTAIRNARKYKNLDFAQSAAVSQVYWVPVIMGSDGSYWVPSTNREAGALLRAGYESA